MVRKTLLATSVALLLAAAWGGPAHAQGTFGRLLVVVTDQNGDPVEGVKVSATCKQLTDFLEAKETNKKGKATLAFGDATKVYDIRIEYPGTAPMEAPFKPAIRKTITQEITLDLSGGGGGTVTSGAPDSGAELTLKPSEKTFNSGIELLQTGDYQGARDKFLQALKGMPESAAVHSALGGVYVELGDHQAAIAAAQKLLEIEPENPRAYRLLYEAHRGLGNQAAAEEALAAMTGLDPDGDTVRIVYNEGVEALRVGDRKAARERFEQALKLDPNLTAAMSALAVLYVQAGEFAPAAELAERLLLLEPGNTKAMMIAFDSYKALADTERERQAFDRILASGSKDIGRLLYESGIDLFNEGKLDGAIRNFQQALEADPSLTRVHYHLGLCLVNKGDQAGAKEHFAEFLDKAPNDPDAPLVTEMLKALG